MNNAPIIIFAYKRPAHLARTLSALAQNPEAIISDLIIYCDGSRGGASDEASKLVDLTRLVAKDETRFASVKVIERESNFGLAKNVTEGVSEVIENFGRAIILEDDLVVSTNFLQFMNIALERYKDAKNVACISGYVYPLIKELPEAFFIRGADCWGWATWSDRWRQFNPDATALKEKLVNSRLQSEFDFNNSYPYFRMLEDREKGVNQSWAVLWYASSFLNNQLCLYPPYSLAHNIGNDGSGTHNLATTSHYDVDVNRSSVIKLPVDIVESNAGRKLFEIFFNATRPSILSRVTGKLRALHKRIRSTGNNEWSGDFDSWSKAQSQCSGYDSSLILDTVLKSVLKVKNGEAAFERDGVTFDTFQFSESVRDVLVETIGKLNHPIVIADFGGSLGSLYFQYKRFIEDSIKSWNVIEQVHFVNAGQENLQDDVLKFYMDFESLRKDDQPDLLILSSVLCYMEDPYSLIEKFKSWNVRYIMIDRTAFIDGVQERITIQQVPKEIYKASYPAWFLNEQKFLKALLPMYRLIRELPDTIDGENYIDELRCYRKGFFLERRILNDK